MDPGMIKNLALGAIPPGVLGLVVFALIWMRVGRGGQELAGRALVWRQAATPLVLMAGFIGTYWLLFGAPVLRPTRSTQWLPVVALGAGIAGVVASLPRAPGVVRWGLVMAALLLGGWASVKNMLAQGGMTVALVEHLSGLVFGAVLALGALWSVSRARRGWAPIVLLVLYCAGVSQLLVIGSYSLALGQLAGISAAVLVGMLLVSLWRPGITMGAGGVAFVVVITQVIAMQGHLYGQGEAELKRAYAYIVPLMLVAAWIAHSALGERAGSRRGAWIVVATAAAVLAIGIAGAGAKRDYDEKHPLIEDDPYAGGARFSVPIRQVASVIGIHRGVSHEIGA